MTSRRKLSALVGAMALTVSLTACGSGGETDDGNSGDGSPTAEPTANDEDSDDNSGSSKQGPEGSGD